MSGKKGTHTTRISQFINAPRSEVYKALIDAKAVESWMVPTGMTSKIHSFDGSEGGTFRISLTYDEQTGTGKTNAHTDTFHGRFVKLIPGELVVQSTEFETEDPSLQGEMTITYTLRDLNGGTEVTGTHEGLPAGIPVADNEKGWQLSLGKLAKLVECMKNENSLSCKLTSPGLQKRKQTVLAVLKTNYSAKKELNNGYSFTFRGDDETLDLLCDFVKSERRCCDFFSFVIRVESPAVISLDITGPEGVKEFIVSELGL